MLKLLALVIALFSCAAKSHKPKHNTTVDPKLEAKAALYLKLFKDRQGPSGFVDGCDSLLYTALAASVGVPNIDVLAARDERDAWHRRPDYNCYPQFSKSEISRDMLLGVTFWSYRRGSAAVIERIIDYAKRNSFIMGKGDENRTTMSAQLLTLMEDAAAKLRNRPLSNSDYSFVSMPTKGHETHLQTLSILLIGDIYGGISGGMLERLRVNSVRNPSNILWRYAHDKYSDYGKEHGHAMSIYLLKDDSYFPNDRLPTSKDYCTGYLWEREDDDDWQPCDENKTHGGVDFLFAYGLVMGKK